MEFNNTSEHQSSSIPGLIFNMTNWTQCEEWKDIHLNTYAALYPIALSSQLLCAVNTLTNLVAYLIFYQDHSVSTFNRLLMNLSLCECLFQLLYIVYTAVEINLLLNSLLLFSSYQSAVYFSRFYHYIILPAFTATHISRNWSVILISLYRFETLVRAFSTKWLLFKKGADLKICVVVFLLSVLIAIPRALERNVYLCSIESKNIYLIVGFGDRAILEEWYNYSYVVATLFIFQNGGPAIIVCTFGSIIIIKLAERRKIKDRLTQKQPTKFEDRENCYQSSTKFSTTPANADNSCRNNAGATNDVSQNEEYTKLNDNIGRKKKKKSFLPFRRNELNQSKRRMTRNRKHSTTVRGGKLVLILSVLFVVCELPSFFNKLFGIFKILQDSGEFIIFSNFATLIDSFVNFFIYLLSNQRFRHSLIQKFIWCCPSWMESRSNRNMAMTNVVTVHLS